MEHEKTVPMISMHQRDIGFIGDSKNGQVAAGMEPWRVRSSERKSQKFKRILLDIYEDRCDSGLHVSNTIQLYSSWKTYGDLKPYLF